MYFELSKLDAQAAEPFYILARIAVRNDKGNFKEVLNISALDYYPAYFIRKTSLFKLKKEQYY